MIFCLPMEIDTMRKIIIILFCLSLVTVLVLVSVNQDKFFQTDEEYFTSLVEEYKTKEFDGIVSQKFKDENDHNFQKIVLDLKNGGSKTIITNFEKEEFYNFIKVGDSLTKKRYSLEVALRRPGVDTTLSFKFENVKDFKKSKVFNSLEKEARNITLDELEDDN